MKDEFFIGWQPRLPSGLARRVRWIVGLLLVFALVIPVVLARSQRTIGRAVFEWGNLKSFTGVYENAPYPHLLVPRPGLVAGAPACSTYYLVAPFKHGLALTNSADLNGQRVRLTGTLIYRGNQTMIEAQPETVQLDAAGGNPLTVKAASLSVDLGTQTLTGEIVDSKCYFGVMNPGDLTPHRGCAVRCISGGIPPVLLVRQKSGPPVYVLLVSSDGLPVNSQILDWVAEPVQITGRVMKQDNLLILYADPRTYHHPAP